MKAKQYQVVCMVCYTCVLATVTSKRRANEIATSHMNQYHHDVSITTPLSVPRDETEGPNNG